MGASNDMNAALRLIVAAWRGVGTRGGAMERRDQHEHGQKKDYQLGLSHRIQKT